MTTILQIYLKFYTLIQISINYVPKGKMGDIRQN